MKTFPGIELVLFILLALLMILIVDIMLYPGEYSAVMQELQDLLLIKE